MQMFRTGLFVGGAICGLGAAMVAAAPTAPAAVMPVQDLPAGSDRGPPAIDYAISDYTTGISYGIAESSYIHQPQIAEVPDTPRPKMIPIHKLPLDEIERSKRGIKMPAPRAVGGFNGVNDNGFLPPDPDCAVGPNHVVEIVNATVAWYNKSTGALQFSQVLDNSGSPGFFEGVGAGGFCFDPRAVYDDVSGRFVVICLEEYGGPQTAFIDIAVSDDSDPNGTWYKYRTDAKTNVGGGNFAWVDYPGLGFDDQAIYVTGNLFGFSTGSFGSKYRIFDKTPLLTGSPAVFSDLRDSATFTARPGQHHTTPIAPYFASNNTSTTIKVQAIQNPLTAPTLLTTTVAVPSYSDPPSAPNLGATSDIDTIDSRVFNTGWRNKSLVCGHSIGSGGKSVARWYEINTKNWPTSGSIALKQSGNVDLGGAVYTFFPAVAMNANDEIGVVLGHSSANEYAGISVAVHRTTDASGVMGVVNRAKLGANSYSNFRWGDYFGCCIDPSDPAKFWGVGEYARSSANSWGTYIVNFDGQPVTPTTGFLLSTRADCSVGGMFFASGDIVRIDPVSGAWSMYFDLSDVKTNGAANVDAFALLADGSLVFSFVASEHLVGMTGGPNGDLVDDEDLVRFVPTSLGEVTAGSWQFYFDGSDVNLDTNEEDVDALAIDGAGNLFISFGGQFDVGGGVTGKDEDVVMFVPTSLGSTTAGTWSMWLNGRDPDMKLGSPGEDVDALDFDPATNKVTVSTTGDYRVPTNVNGQKRDLFVLTATQFGTDTNGTWANLFDGDLFGLDATADDDIDALEILP